MSSSVIHQSPVHTPSDVHSSPVPVQSRAPRMSRRARRTRNRRLYQKQQQPRIAPSTVSGIPVTTKKFEVLAEENADVDLAPYPTRPVVRVTQDTSRV